MVTYIDSNWTGTESGTIEEPLSDFPTSDNILSGNDYLIKSGSNFNFTSIRYIDTKNTITIGKYGTGPLPILTGYAEVTDTADFTNVSGDIWVFDTGQLAFREPILLGLGELGDKDNCSFTQRVNYLGGGTAPSGPGAFTTHGQWDFEGGSGASTAKLYIYSDINPVTKWGTIYYTQRNFGQLLYVRAGSYDITIQDLNFKNCFTGITSLSSTADNYNQTFQRNVFEHSRLGVQLNGGANDMRSVHLINNNFYSIGNIAIYPYQNLGAGCIIENNGIYNTGCNGHEGIGAIYGRCTASEEVLIAGNIIDTVIKGVYWTGEAYGLYSERGTTNVKYSANEVYNIVESGALHTNGGTVNVTFEGNFAMNVKVGFSSSDSNAEQADDITLANNVLFANEDGATFNRPTALGTFAAVLKNNILVGSGIGEGISSDNEVDTLDGIIEDYNYVYNFATTRAGGGGVLGSNSSDTDPGISSNGYPNATSPCIGAGTKWWTGPNPNTIFEPVSDFATDIGLQSTYSLLHPKNL